LIQKEQITEYKNFKLIRYFFNATKMKKEKLLVCTFSGGRTSAFMSQFINNYSKYNDFDKIFVFANTGKEREETLEFVNKCDKKFGLNIVWLEAKVNKQKNVGTSYKIVNFETASRNGEPFESMLKKYSMPNMFASNCTRELKLRPINKYVKQLGYKEIKTAMGIRFDEKHRTSNMAKEEGVIYPLIDDIQVDSKFVRSWWDNQEFDLKLKDYEGNCDLCFKKSLRKKLTIIKNNPSIAQWWDKMEQNHGTEKIPRFELAVNGKKGHSIKQLIELAKKTFQTVEDVHELSKKQTCLFDFDLDNEKDCFCKTT